MAALADSSKRWHIVLRCTICGPLGLLFYLVALILNFYLLLKNFNLGCYLVMFAARRASLSSDNSFGSHTKLSNFKVFKVFKIMCSLINQGMRNALIILVLNV